MVFGVSHVFGQFRKVSLGLRLFAFGWGRLSHNPACGIAVYISNGSTIYIGWFQVSPFVADAEVWHLTWLNYSHFNHRPKRMHFGLDV